MSKMLNFFTALKEAKTPTEFVQFVETSVNASKVLPSDRQYCKPGKDGNTTLAN
jgi:hypothetical protein